MTRSDFFTCVALVAFILLVIFYLNNRAEECEKSGGVLVRSVFNYKCIKVTK